jgi:putative inorganic carbon (hco3(-)) transporter
LTHFDRLQGVDDATELSRLALWQAAFSLFVGHPVLGIGYGNYKYLYTSFMTISAQLDTLDAHNLYLQLLSETGLIGFLVFGAIVALFFRLSSTLIRNQDSLRRIIGVGMFGSLTGFLIHGVVDFMFHVSPQFGALFWMMLGFCTGAVTMKPAAD